MTPSEAAVFRHLYESYYRQLFAYCRRRTDAASVDDLVADVFLTVWRRIADAPTGDRQLAWLYRIAHHHAGNHWRGSGRRRKLTTKLESIAIQPIPLVQDQVIVREEVRQVLAAAQHLRGQDVEILRLALWEHMSSEDIADVLDITPNAAKQRLHRARKKLVREFERNQRSVTPAAQKGGEQ